MPVVGFLDLRSPSLHVADVAAFRQGLAAAGFVEGQTVAIEYRWANNRWQRLAPLAAELVQRQVAVIVAIDSGPTVLAAKAATSIIPIVFAVPDDPIKFGLCNGPGFVKVISPLASHPFRRGRASVRGRRAGRHLMGFEEDRST
jgi:hypothetical protein